MVDRTRITPTPLRDATPADKRATLAAVEKLAGADRRRARFQDMAAEGLIAFDELRDKLAALAETKQRVRRELSILQGRRERLENLERDKSALLEHYASMVPDELDDLSAEERNRVYKMLGLGVTVRPSGVLEVSGTFGEGLELSKRSPTPACRSNNPQRLWLGFRTLLTERGAERVELLKPDSAAPISSEAQITTQGRDRRRTGA